MNNLRLKEIALTVILLMTAINVSANDDSYYDVTDYTATIHKNNVWDVTENTKVVFTQPHHGITRWIKKVYNMHIARTTFGIDYSDDRTFESKITFNKSTFKIDGKKTNAYEITDEDEEIDIKMGSKSITLSGNHTFSYSYTTAIPDDDDGNKDVVYKTLLPSAMHKPTKTFNVTLKFDEALPASAKSTLKVFVGKQGSKDISHTSDFRIIDSHTIVGTVHDIPAYNAVTIRFELPQGYFDTDHKPWWYRSMYLFFGLTMLIVIYIVVKFLLRKPQVVTKQIEFYPPKNISSAEAGVIIDNRVDDEDLASLIPWFASNGYITVKQVKGDNNKDEMILRRVKALPEDAPEYQQNFMKVLFDEQGVEEINMKDIKYTSKMQETKDALKKFYDDDKKLVDDGETYKWALLLILFGLFTLISDNPDGLFSWSCIGMLIAYGIFYALSAVIGLILTSVFVEDAKLGKSWSRGLLVTKFIIMLVCFWFLSDNIEGFYSVEIAFYTFIFSFVAIECASKLSINTPLRMEYLGRLLGLKEFIETAEKYRLETLIRDDPEYFYKILPYAMVLDVKSQWGEKFKDIQMEKPEWLEYDSADLARDVFTYSMIDNFMSSSSNVVSTAMEKPQEKDYSSNTESHRDDDSYDYDYSYDSDGDSGGGDGDGGGDFW